MHLDDSPGRYRPRGVVPLAHVGVLVVGVDVAYVEDGVVFDDGSRGRNEAVRAQPLELWLGSTSDDTRQRDFVPGDCADIFRRFDHIRFHCMKGKGRRIFHSRAHNASSCGFVAVQTPKKDALWQKAKKEGGVPSQQNGVLALAICISTIRHKFL